jgi:hypothetical protein
VRESSPIYVIDPNEVPVPGASGINVIKEKASEGVQTLIKKLRNV